MLLMQGKMEAGAFGRARNYGWDGPFNKVVDFLTWIIIVSVNKASDPHVMNRKLTNDISRTNLAI